MKTNIQYRRGFTLVELLVVIVIIAALAGLAAPMVMSQRKKADLIQATSNAKNIGIAMMEFETSYASFPDQDTAQALTDAGFGTGLTITGTDANAHFRQFFAAEITQSEEMFYAKASYSKKPDNIATGTKCLEDGEVGFGYILNGTAGFSNAGNPGRPIVVAPFTTGLSSEEFDPDLYDYKAVALMIDSSVKQLQIRKSDKKAILGNKPLTDAGAESVWGDGVTPTISYPLPK